MRSLNLCRHHGAVPLVLRRFDIDARLFRIECTMTREVSRCGCSGVSFAVATAGLLSAPGDDPDKAKPPG